MKAQEVKDDNKGRFCTDKNKQDVGCLRDNIWSIVLETVGIKHILRMKSHFQKILLKCPPQIIFLKNSSDSKSDVQQRRVNNIRIIIFRSDDTTHNLRIFNGKSRDAVVRGI